MKQSELKKIIREEVQKELVIEGIIDSLIMLFISPKIRRDIKQLKGSPEWIELNQQFKKNQEEMQMVANRIEDQLKKYKEFEAEAKKKGYPVMSYAKFKKLGKY